LSQTGAISAALVVSGGLIYAYQTSIAKSSGSGASAKSKKSNAAAKPTRSSARVAAAAKSETIRKRR